jgi:membrane protein implicated in regulation of membrane protease activity
MSSETEQSTMWMTPYKRYADFLGAAMFVTLLVSVALFTIATVTFSSVAWNMLYVAILSFLWIPMTTKVFASYTPDFQAAFAATPLPTQTQQRMQWALCASLVQIHVALFLFTVVLLFSWTWVWTTLYLIVSVIYYYALYMVSVCHSRHSKEDQEVGRLEEQVNKDGDTTIALSEAGWDEEEDRDALGVARQMSVIEEATVITVENTLGGNAATDQ